MKKKRLLWLIPLILLLAVLVWAGIFYFILRGRSLESRPLVLLTSPLNGQYVETGKSVGVQAVARADKGVQRMQVWVDDELVAEKKVSEGETNSPLVIMANWVPAMSGRHVVSVRAFSADGVSGQSTVYVTAEQETAARYVVQEGETLEVIAASYGVDAAAIIDANAAAGAAGPQAGDELDIPAAGGGSAPPFDSWGEEVTPADDRGGGRIGPDDSAGAGNDVPSVPAPEPGSIESMDLFWFAELFQAPTDPVELVIEVTGLQTREEYEGLHCYVSLAGSTPTWVPDADMDQSTDETFQSRAEGTEWNVGQYLSDTESTTIMWDRNTPVPLDISCVGVSGGGLNAVELGRLLDEVSPDQWGVPQTARSSGGESQFNLAYLVTYPEKGLDLAMTSPWDVRLHQDASTLSWSYLPDVDGAPAVDGFAIFLNDQLQFTVDGRTREVDIPPQWFDVPCDNQYRFTVIAFLDTYPEGDYSPSSEPAVLTGGEAGTEGCPLSVTITFQVLNVGNLGNPIPITAYFIANDQRLTLDGTNGVLVPEEDVYGIPRPELYVDETSTPPKLGLEDNHGYRIPSLFYATLSRYGQLRLELPYDDPEDPYDSLQLGFEIYGPDNRLLCGGDLAVSAEDARQGIIGDINNEYPQEGVPNLCVVTLELSPVIEGASEEPLPDLEVEGITYDYTHGFHVLHLRNTGQADWVNQNLVIEATTRDGELIDRYTFRNATLEVNEHGQLGDRQFNWEPILSACVELDPDNLVREKIDRVIESGFIHQRGRFCPGLPDLLITGVEYDQVAEAALITIENHGETLAADIEGYGDLPQIDLQLQFLYPDGSTALEEVIEGFSLVNHQSATLSLPVSQGLHGNLSAHGYTVAVNTDHEVLEEDFDNNEYTVEPMKMLRVAWRETFAEFCPSGLVLATGDNTWQYHLTANVIGGDSEYSVADWDSPEIEIDDNEHTGESWCPYAADYLSPWFWVDGDETLTISLSADLDIQGFGSHDLEGFTETLNTANGFGGTTLLPEDVRNDCYNHPVRIYEELNGGIGCGNVVSESACPYDFNSGMHVSGGEPVHEDDVNGHCYWSTTYMIYELEDVEE